MLGCKVRIENLRFLSSQKDSKTLFYGNKCERDVNVIENKKWRANRYRFSRLNYPSIANNSDIAAGTITNKAKKPSANTLFVYQSIVFESPIEMQSNIRIIVEHKNFIESNPVLST